MGAFAFYILICWLGGPEQFVDFDDYGFSADEWYEEYEYN